MCQLLSPRVLLAATMVFASASMTPTAHSSVYVNADDLDLRNSINILANANIINIPMQQFPMPWRAILLDLETVDSSALETTQQLALLHVRHHLRNAQNGPQTQVKVQAGTDNSAISGFGRSPKERGKLSVARHFKGERLAARLQINHRWQPYENDNEQTLDGSYLAYNFDDLSVSFDALPLWWGPAQNSSLLLSTNARPFSKIRLDYSPDFAPAGFNPMHISAFVGYNKTQFGANSVSREVVGLRAATTVNWGIDAGISAVHQTADSGAIDLPENTMISVDARKGWNWGKHSLAAYAEIGFDGQLEDGETPAFTLGTEWQFNGSWWGQTDMRHTFVAEYTDTESKSFYQRLTTTSGQPFYQHYQRNIGSSFAPDSKTVSLSYRLFKADGSGWGLKLARASLVNDSNQTQALIRRSQPLLAGLLNVELEYADQVYSQDTDEFTARFSWEWRF